MLGTVCKSSVNVPPVCMGKCVIKITCYVKYSANLLITFADQCKYGITGLPCIYMSLNRPAKIVFFHPVIVSYLP